MAGSGAAEAAIDTHPHDVVVAVVRDAAGRVWVQQRREDGPLDGLWEFPGGKCEPNEALREALVREVAEETGAVVEPGDLLAQREHQYPGRLVRVRFYAAALIPGSTLPEDDRRRWVAPADLATLPIPEANRELVARLAAAGNQP